MFGGYQETSRESVVTSVIVGQSGGEAAEQKGWQGREQKRISRLNTAWAENRTIIIKAYTTNIQHRLGMDMIQVFIEERYHQCCFTTHCR